MEDLLLRVRDFGIDDKDLMKCAKKTAKKYRITEKEVFTSALSLLLSRQRKCIHQAAEHDMKLEHYQEKAVKHMLTHRGLILSFDAGTGKTLTAVTISSCILLVSEFLSIDIDIIVITPTSLQANFKKEMKAYGMNPNDKRYRFYTTAGFGIAYKKGNIDCSRTFLIIDEAHDLRTDYRQEFIEFKIGEPKKDSRAELAIKCASKAWKVLLLTASPVYDYDYHIVNLASMVLGIYPPLNLYEFSKLLSDKKLFSKVFGCMFAFYESPPEGYPERRDEIVKIEMTEEYYRRYLAEKSKIKVGKKSSKDAFMMKLRTATLNLEPHLKQREAMKLLREGEKTLVYSEFLRGVEILKGMLDEEGMEYLQIKGDVPKAKRENIVNEFNSEEGANILLISKAGGQGLDLKGGKKVILLEPGWTMEGEQQVVFRVRRKHSHAHLPPSERYFTVYHFIMTLPKSIKCPVPNYEDVIASRIIGGKDCISADEYLYMKSRIKYEDAQRMKRRLKNIDIFHLDCDHLDAPKFERGKLEF